MTAAFGGLPADDLVAEVLDLVELIPAGRVMTYGDIAAVIGRGGARHVGRVMSAWGSSVPWWRVVPAHGGGPSGHETVALRHYVAEGTPLRPGGTRIDLARARWSPSEPPPPAIGPDIEVEDEGELS